MRIGSRSLRRGLARRVPGAAACASACASACLLVGASAVAAAQPNILLIISDDAGWADFGFNDLGNGEIPTPALDSIADRGVRFNAAYTSPVCSVSRARFFLGQHPQRSGYQDNAPDSTDASDANVEGLRLEDVTMFERLRDAGYHVGFFGKWHLGMEKDITDAGSLVTPGNLPPRHGIDRFLGVLNGSRQYEMGASTSFGSSLREQSLDPATGLVIDAYREDDWPAGDYFTDVLAGAVADHITVRAAEPEPFFVVASFTAPHSPLQATQHYLDLIDAATPGLTGDRRTYAAMMLAFDTGVRTILDRLDDPDGDGDPADSVTADTLICFLNDNGGQTERGALNDPLRGGKGETWDGGVRVPMLLAGPGVPESGIAFDHPVDSVDLLPTFLAAAGAPQPGPGETDGVNLLPYLNGEVTGQPHPHLYVRGGEIAKIGVRRDQYKLTTNLASGPLLFDIVDRIDERGRLEGDLPGVVHELWNIMYAHEAEYAKPRWGGNDYNDGDVFDYRAGSAGSAAWSAPFAWAIEDGPSEATMQARDGYANLVARFPVNPAPYTATNDRERPNGALMMINAIELIGEHSGPSESAATIDGLPLLFIDSLAADPARISMLASGPVQHAFALGLGLVLFDDLMLDGDGTQTLILSGGITEQRIGRDITRAGGWTLDLRSPIDVSGTVTLQSGQTLVTPPGRLDSAALAIGGTAGLVLDDPSAGPPGFIADDAAVLIESPIDGPRIGLQFNGLETIGELRIDGSPLAPGDYGAATHPGVFTGPGQLRVVSAPACGPADLAPPFGVLDLADLNAFVAGFVSADPIADLNADGLYDLTDLGAFVAAFTAGCP